ncbi:MAG: transposase [Bacteroidetes bacterium]|nr:transposase [Bacteroidota bacterium]
MTERYQNKYRISSARLPGYDYGAPGWYFVTICTHNRHCYFGDVVDGEMHHSAVGQQAHDNWQAIPKYFDHARLDAFVVMPNHVHGLVGLVARDESETDHENNTVGTRAESETDHENDTVETRQWHVSTATPESGKKPDRTNPPQDPAMSAITPDAGSLAVIINQYKGAVTRWARRNGVRDFAWQPRFYDRVVRNKEERLRIRRYIENNPANWPRDRSHRAHQ